MQSSETELLEFYAAALSPNYRGEARRCRPLEMKSLCKIRILLFALMAFAMSAKELNAPTNSVDCANLLNMKSEKASRL